MVVAVPLPTSRPLHLDHVPIAVRDLPAALDEFRALGFTIKPGRPHQNGIENASVKFLDGSYVELITSHEASDILSREYQNSCATRKARPTYSFAISRRRIFITPLKAGGRREESGPFAFIELPSAWKAPRLQLIQYLAPARTRRRLFNIQRRPRVCRDLDDRRSGVRPVVQAFGANRAGSSAFAFEKRDAEAIELANGTCLIFTPRRPMIPRDQSRSRSSSRSSRSPTDADGGRSLTDAWSSGVAGTRTDARRLARFHRALGVGRDSMCGLTCGIYK